MTDAKSNSEASNRHPAPTLTRIRASGTPSVRLPQEAPLTNGEVFKPFTEDEVKTLESIEVHSHRGLYLMGCVSDRIPGDLKPVIVGGFAVEFSTAGGYSTSDIDLAYPEPGTLGAVLEGNGFIKVNRHWVSTRFHLQLEVPLPTIERTVLDHVVTVEVDGRHVVMIGIEDLIVDRLRRCQYGKSSGDLHWAASLYAIYDKQLDLPYLSARARQSGSTMHCSARKSGQNRAVMMPRTVNYAEFQREWRGEALMVKRSW